MVFPFPVHIGRVDPPLYHWIRFRHAFFFYSEVVLSFTQIGRPQSPEIPSFSSFAFVLVSFLSLWLHCELEKGSQNAGPSRRSPVIRLRFCERSCRPAYLTLQRPAECAGRMLAIEPLGMHLLFTLITMSAKEDSCSRRLQYQLIRPGTALKEASSPPSSLLNLGRWKAQIYMFLFIYFCIRTRC